MNILRLAPKSPASLLRRSTRTLASAFTLTLILAGCTTPDLQPFSGASQTVASSIKQGGDTLVSALANETIEIGGNPISPGSPDHPAQAITKQWIARKKAADALLVYSTSLTAIGEASANRKANAAQLYTSVQKLAESIPGVSLGTSAAGNLLISATSGVIEIKAWHNMASAIHGADPAIQMIARVLAADFASLAQAHSSHYKTALLLRETNEAMVLRKLATKLRDQQSKQRGLLANDPVGPAATELMRLDSLLTPVQRDLDAYDAETARITKLREQGEQFYAQAGATVNAWAAAHADLGRAFDQNRHPDLALLIERARELNDCVTALKTNK